MVNYRRQILNKASLIMLRIYSLALVASALFVVLYLVFALTGTIFFYESGEAIGTISDWCERVSGGSLSRTCKYLK